MPFVSRDPSGRIVALSDTPPADVSSADGGEQLPATHPEVLAFLFGDGDDPQARLFASDLALIRVVEDLVEVLVKKHVITLTDLPAAAQDKLMGRRSLRAYLSGVSGLIDGDVGKLI
jgi:hypothetical protein